MATRRVLPIRDPEDFFAALSPQRWVYVEDDSLPWEGGVCLRVGIDAGGRLVCTGLLVGGDIPDEEVTQGQLRSVHIAKMLAELEKMAAGKHGKAAQAWAEQVGIGRAAPFERPKVRPGAAGYPDEFYREVADKYCEALASQPHRPTAALIDMVRHPKDGSRVGASTVRYWLKRAEDLGFLAPSEPGRARSVTNKENDDA